jgi:hypothetical protein
MIQEAEVQRIGLLEPNMIFGCWPGILRSLDKIPHFWDLYTPESIFELATKGKMQIWLIGDDTDIELLILTEVIQMPRARILRLMAASGDNLETYEDRLHDVFEGYAKIQDCARIEIIGRPGWKRKFKRFRDPSYDMVVVSRAVETRSVQ